MLNFDILFAPVVRVIAIVAMMLIPNFFVMTKRKNKVSDAFLILLIVILVSYPILIYKGDLYKEIPIPGFIYLINSLVVARAVSLSFKFKGILTEIENFNKFWGLDFLIIAGICYGALAIDRNENFLNYVMLPYVGGLISYQLNKCIYTVLGKLPKTNIKKE